MIYFVFENPGNQAFSSFVKKYGSLDYTLLFSRKRCYSNKELFVECCNIMRTIKTGDTVVCWYDFVGVLCWWLTRFSRKKIKIVIINILLKDKPTLKNKVARWLYRKALNGNNVRASVSSQEYGKWVNDLLLIDKDYQLIHDVYHESYNINYGGDVIPNTVFCGGRNARDWALVFKLTEKMKDVTFNLVMSKADYLAHARKAGENVLVKTDIAANEFLIEMCKSSLVIMPLNTEAPAGLIVMFQAGANGKPFIISDTVTTREYINEDRAYLCGNNVDDWEKKIREIFSENEEVLRQKENTFKEFLQTECSKSHFMKGVDRMVMDLLEQ